jgi:hypothetical protein
MGSLFDSLQIRGFYQTRSKVTDPGKITIGSIRIKTILGMTEKEIGKGPGGQIIGLSEKEAGAEPDQYHRGTFRRYTQFLGVSEEEESPAQLGRHMQGR